MSDETQNQITADETLTSSDPKVTYSSVKQVTENKKTAVLVSVNAANAPKINGPIPLPKLQESAQTGYVRGKSQSITCCTVGRLLIEKNTAYDYIMMAAAAARDGIVLQLSSGFRSMEQQQKLFTERSVKAVADKLGVAARPGYSNHQSGRALDIDVKMTKAMYMAKPPQYTAEYLWLAGDGTPQNPGHAAGYGFDHAEGHSVNEPWHWTHLKKEISGAPAFYAATGFTELTEETALAAASLNIAGTKRGVYKAAHDLAVSLSRSASMGGTSRASLFKEQASFCANQSNGLSHATSQFEASTLEAEPAAFNLTTLASFSYNFETGKWEDGDAV